MIGNRIEYFCFSLKHNILLIRNHIGYIWPWSIEVILWFSIAWYFPELIFTFISRPQTTNVCKENHGLYIINWSNILHHEFSYMLFLNLLAIETVKVFNFLKSHIFCLPVGLCLFTRSSSAVLFCCFTAQMSHDCPGSSHVRWDSRRWGGGCSLWSLLGCGIYWRLGIASFNILQMMLLSLPMA